MKKITIEKLILENFKCHRHFVLELGGRSAALHGDNATGKTSVYDALTWLLFGKDSKGNGEKNIDIKPLDSEGNVADHEAITSVEAVFSCDGEALSLKRTLREIWQTKRGSSTLSYEGNTSDYFVDSVPCKKYEFDRRISELFGEKAWRVLTSVSYFASEMDWRERRALLFDLSGIHSDREIMESDSQFGPLQAAMGKLSVEDFRKVLTSQKKGLTDVRKENPAKLEALGELERELQTVDFASVREEAALLSEQKEELLRQLAQIGQDGAADAVDKEIYRIKLELAALESENRSHREKQLRNQPNVAEQKRQLTQIEQEKRRCQDRLLRLQPEGDRLAEGISAARERWIAVNNEEFRGGDCPTCGQSLPMEQLMAARERFEKNKQERLEEIQRSAEAKKEAKSQLEEQVATLQEQLDEGRRKIDGLRREIAEGERAQFSPSDLPDYGEKKQALLAQTAALEEKKRSIQQDSSLVEAELRCRLREVNEKLEGVLGECSKEQTLRSVQEKMAILREESRKAAAEMERLESLQFLLEVFVRYKTRFVEDTVNSQFRLAKFRLFREQANGGVEERCDVTLEGIPYDSLNSGAKINVGIDLINTLSGYFGLLVPLFVDNAESVTRLEALSAQRIRLVVSEQDKKLRCEYEN